MSKSSECSQLLLARTTQIRMYDSDFRMTRLALTTLLLLIVAVTAAGQATNSALTGTVTTNGKALPGVTVTIFSPALLGVRSTLSGPSGDYFFAALPPGPYDITFELEGMQTMNRRAALRLA